MIELDIISINYMARLVSAISLIGLAGCGSSPESRYYLLTPESASADLAGTTGEGPRIVVSEATVSPYFDRSQMISRRGEFRIEYDEFDVWGEPVNLLITRKLVDDLGRQFGRNKVLSLKSGRAFDADYVVGIDVLRFDSNGLGMVTVDARWQLDQETRGCLVASDRTIVTKTYYDQEAFDARVAAFSEALSEIANEIADSINEASETEKDCI